MTDKDDSLLGDLISMIPGYGAYRDQQSRRDDDRLTREFLGRRLRDCKSNLEAIGKRAVAEGDLELPAQVEKICNRVELAQNRLSSAVEGYAGWFSERKVDAKLLEEIGTLDANLVSLVDQLDSLTESAAEQSLASSAKEIDEALDLLHARIDRRTEVLKNGS